MARHSHSSFGCRQRECMITKANPVALLNVYGIATLGALCDSRRTDYLRHSREVGRPWSVVPVGTRDLGCFSVHNWRSSALPDVSAWIGRDAFALADMAIAEPTQVVELATDFLNRWRKNSCHLASCPMVPCSRFLLRQVPRGCHIYCS